MESYGRMWQIGVAALAGAVFWGLVAFRRTDEKPREERFREAWRMFVGGAFLLYAVIDWIRMVVQSWR